MASTQRKTPLLATREGSASGVSETDRTGKTSKAKSGKSPRAASPRSNPLGGGGSKKGSTTPRAGSSTPRGSSSSSSSKKPPGLPGAKGAGAAAGKPGSSKEPAATDRGGFRPGSKPSAAPLAAEAASSSNASAKDEKKPSGPVGPNAKKIEYLSEELLARKPLEGKAYEALVKKAGSPKQEVHFERNENHRPIGRPDELTPSRHERIPPTFIVLMFNCFEASFDLVHGDISTLPESDTTELRSLTSGKSLGRVKITPEKGTRAPWRQQPSSSRSLCMRSALRTQHCTRTRAHARTP